MQLHPQEALLQQARALQQSEVFAEYRQRRVVVEHRLARLVPTGNTPGLLLRPCQNEIRDVRGGHGGQPDPGGRQGQFASRHAPSTTLPLSSRRPAVSFGGFGFSRSGAVLGPGREADRTVIEVVQPLRV